MLIILTCVCACITLLCMLLMRKKYITCKRLEQECATYRTQYEKASNALRDNEATLQHLNHEQTRLQVLLDTQAQHIADLKQSHSTHIHELRTQHKEDLLALDARHKESLLALESTLEKHLHNQTKHLESQKQAMLHEQKLTLTNDSFKILDGIFTPLKTRVEEYEKRLTQHEIAFKTNIDNAFKYSQEMSKNAQELGRILKEDKKLRGNFGELQLKSVLEGSGLIEGRQYELQPHLSIHKKNYYPDAIVMLDEERKIIIDAKFPLPNSNDEQSDSMISAKEIANNLRHRIDELADKPYKELEHSYEYMLLFIPYNNLLDLAISADASLYQYAEHKHIYLTTPNTLFMALKTIAITWQHLQSDKHIKEVFYELGRFYDKFVGVCVDFDTLASRILSAQVATKHLGSKLRGKGGLESLYEKLHTLGAKKTKSLPPIKQHHITHDEIDDINE